MLRSACRIAVTVLVVTPLCASAQETLTLDAAVQAALAQNPSLRAAHAGVDEASAQAAEARSTFFPRISATESWQRGNDPTFVFSSLLSSREFAAANFAIDALNHPNPIGFFRASVGVEQTVFDGGRLRSLVNSAALRRTIAEASFDEATASVALATTSAYGRLVSAVAARRAADAGTAAAREDLARAERRRDSGMASDADVLALVVHVAELQQRAIQAEGDSSAAHAELNRLMGSPIDHVFQAVEPSGASPNDVGDHPDVTALLAEADARRPEIKRSAASEQIAANVGRQARAALIPQVAAQGAFAMAGTEIADRASSWIVGGELRWTFSTGGGELAALRAAAASRAQARAQADDVRAAVHVEVVSALSRVESARARLAVSRAAVDQARESQRIIRDRFEAGLASVNDVLRASTAELDADANRVGALVDGMVADVGLRRALGRTF